MSQSSVEFYIHNLIDILGDDVCNKLTIDQTNKIHNLGNQAVEMHKQESIAAQMDMFHHLNNLPFGMQYLDKRESAEKFAEQYYNETFGGYNE